MKPRTATLVALACLVLLFAQRAARADTPPPPPFACAPIPVFPAAVIFAEYPHFYYYCKNKSTVADAQSAMPADVPIYLRNGSSLRIVVMDINPVSQQVNVAIGSAKPYTELDSNVVQGVFQAKLPANATSPPNPKPGSVASQEKNALKDVLGNIQTPTDEAILNQAFAAQFSTLSVDQQKEKAPAVLQQLNSCQAPHDQIDQQITALRADVDALTDQVNEYNSASTTLQQNYSNLVNALMSKSIALQSDFTGQVRSFGPFLTTPPRFVSTNGELNGKDLSTAISLIRNRAVQLHGSLTQGLDAKCQSLYKDELANDQDYLENLFNTTKTNTSLADTLTNELTADNELRSQLSEAVSALFKLVSNPENYMYITTIPPEDRIQDQVLVTVTVQQRDLSVPSADPAPAGKKAPAAPAKATNATLATTAFTLSFGAGPITFESAGMVFTPLPQHSFATATTTTTSGQACSASVTTGNYCIVDNAGSGWRILPMAVVSARYWTLDSSYNRAQFLLPNYLSAGATIKSNSSAGSSTSLEYLLGFSWAIPVVSPYHSPNLFATVGAYAGEVSQLGGGLKLGVQNGTAPATLPTSSVYKWKFGFAVTYAFGSQGGNAKPAKTSSNGKDQTSSTPLTSQ